MLPVFLTRHRTGQTDPFQWIDREFDRLLNRSEQPEAEARTAATYPVDVREDQGHFYVDAELPGFTKDQVDITLNEDVLTIQAERKAEAAGGSGGDPAGGSGGGSGGSSGGGKVHLNERRYARVSRSFRLPTEVDANKVEATLTDGVLHLTLHKAEAVKPRRIEVK